MRCGIRGKEVKVTKFKGNSMVATWKISDVWRVGILDNCSLVGKPYQENDKPSALRRHRSIVRKMKEWKDPL